VRRGTLRVRAYVRTYVRNDSAANGDSLPLLMADERLGPGASDLGIPGLRAYGYMSMMIQSRRPRAACRRLLPERRTRTGYEGPGMASALG
jgi:hypothetical protein